MTSMLVTFKVTAIGKLVTFVVTSVRKTSYVCSYICMENQLDL